MIQESVGDLRELASKVLQHSELQQIALANVTSTSRLPTPSASLDVNIEVGSKGEQPEQGLVRVWVRYEVIATNAEDVGAQAWSIDAEWFADYSGTEMPVFTRRELNAFALVLGPPTIHPYARQLVQDITGQGAYPAFTLDLMLPITSMPSEAVLELDDDYDPDAAEDGSTSPAWAEA